ncbi:MAG: TIGR02996 domain-containing protein [Gemmataceae bacterium]|nr:TIGR02996 domain-containing protein [Gemmataceae bacterium]
MSDKAALVRAIADDPGDDTVRLAFADWLDEHGDAADRARAEFIRVQIARGNRALA